MSCTRVYVMYRGEEVIGIGTAEELAERLGIKPETVRWCSTQTCHRRGGKRRLVAVAVTVRDW